MRTIVLLCWVNWSLASAMADQPDPVLLRVQNYWDVPVSVEITPGSSSQPYTLQRNIPGLGSLVTDVEPNSKIAFSKGGSVTDQYLVTKEETQLVRLGPGVNRAIHNATAGEIRVLQVFVDPSRPDNLSQKQLFTISPGKTSKHQFFYDTVLRFADSSGPIEADYIVQSENQSDRYTIQPQAIILANLSWLPVEVRLKTANHSKGTLIRRLAAKSKTLPFQLPLDSVLSFTSRGKKAMPDYRVTSETDQVVQIPWRYDEDPEWHQWVTSSGDYTNYSLQSPVDANAAGYFGHQFPAVNFCRFGYDISRVRPANLGDYPGTNRLPIFCSLEKPRGENHWSIGKDGSGLLLPSYLSLTPNAGGTSKVKSCVFKSESERQNAFRPGIVVPVVKMDFSFNQSSKDSQSSSALTKESFEVSWFDWVSLNKSEIVLDPEFVSEVLRLRNGKRADYAKFVENYGTHYALATLFGGIRSVQEKATVTGSTISSETAFSLGVVTDSMANTDSTTTNESLEKGSVYGAMTNDRQTMKPVHVIFAPIDELIRSQLFDGVDVLSIRQSLKDYIDNYILDASKVTAEVHRVFSISTEAHAGVETKLFYYNCDVDPPLLYNGFPVDHQGSSGPNRSTLVVTDTWDEVRAARAVAWFNEIKTSDLGSYHSQKVGRLPIFPHLKKEGIHFDLLHIDRWYLTSGTKEHEQPFKTKNIDTPDYSKTSTVGIDSGIPFQNAVRARNARLKILALAKKSPAVRLIESTRSSSGKPADIINDRMRRANAQGLTEYAAALQELSQSEPYCWIGYWEPGGNVSLSVSEVTHNNMVDLEFPPAPAKIEIWVKNNIDSQDLP